MASSALSMLHQARAQHPRRPALTRWRGDHVLQGARVLSCVQHHLCRAEHRLQALRDKPRGDMGAGAATSRRTRAGGCSSTARRWDDAWGPCARAHLRRQLLRDVPRQARAHACGWVQATEWTRRQARRDLNYPAGGSPRHGGRPHRAACREHPASACTNPTITAAGCSSGMHEALKSARRLQLPAAPPACPAHLRLPEPQS